MHVRQYGRLSEPPRAAGRPPCSSRYAIAYCLSLCQLVTATENKLVTATENSHQHPACSRQWTHHHALVAGAADNGGEDGAGGIVARKAGLHHAGAIVAHNRADLALVCGGRGGGAAAVRGRAGRLGSQPFKGCCWVI